MAALKIDTGSETWAIVSKWADEKLKELRAKLEQPETDFPTTQRLRGELKNLRELIALGKARPAASRPVHVGEFGGPELYRG